MKPKQTILGKHRLNILISPTA